MADVLRDQRARARTLLPPDVFDYYALGAGDGVALAEAELAWQRYRLGPRVLRDVASVSLRCALPGLDLPHPLLLGPTAFQHLAHPEGEVETARGAGGATMVVSARASRTIEDIAAVGTPWWLQVYVTRERTVTEAYVRRAVAAGARALVLTGDTPYIGRKARAGLPVSLADPVALVNLGRHLPPGADPVEAIEQDPSVTLDTIGSLASLSGRPVLVKGVLRADDAVDCVAAGAAGLVVSNHGGRQAARAVSTASAQPEVVAAVGDVPVLVDGGLRSGADIATALALGARAVLLGKPVLWALAADGANGVRRMLDWLVDDLSLTSALLGAKSPAELDPSFVRLAGAPTA